MNFYIGNTIDDIEYNEFNIEFSDELIDYIYNKRDESLIDMSKLYSIDPYSDVEIAKDNLYKIVEICNYILQGSLLDEYEELEEGKEMVRDLVDIAREAISKNMGLVSIGD